LWVEIQLKYKLVVGGNSTQIQACCGWKFNSNTSFLWVQIQLKYKLLVGANSTQIQACCGWKFKSNPSAQNKRQNDMTQRMVFYLISGSGYL